MVTQRQQLEASIDALQGQRATLGDQVVDLAIAALREKLAALPAAGHGEAQALRLVSVLFADIVGSTELSQRLDPEDAHAVFDSVLARCTVVVAAHRGKVLQYAGDALLAVFGADETHEDDAERAVHAGLALLDEARRLRQEVRRTRGSEGLELRVGIHTGGVLLGGGVDGDGTVRGSTVHLAARMEQTAPAGSLRISHDTYRHVRGVFDVLPQPPLTLKGFDEPVVTYLVQRAKPRAFRVASRGIEGLDTRLIGRDVELARLQQAFGAVIDTRRLQRVTVLADAGLGKSRLVHEFERWAETSSVSFHRFRGRAQPPPRTQPYGLLRDLLAWRLQIADSDSADAARRKFESGIAPLFGSLTADTEAHVHLLGQLIGLDFGNSPHVRPLAQDALQLRQRGFHAATQLLRSLDAPAVLLLDDVHWADEGSLDFLDALYATAGDAAALVIALARPTLLERRPAWGSAAAGELRIELTALDALRSGELADTLLQRLEPVPAALRELLVAGSEGNPFFMEERVKMLIDTGAIHAGAQRWSLVPERLMQTALPTTLAGVLQARLDGLPAAEKHALQQAAVIGAVFWDHALAALDADATQALPALLRRDLLVRHAESAFAGQTEYAFRHHLMHQATYETLLRRNRRPAHARAAAWFAAQVGRGATQWLQSAAEHFEQAGDAAGALAHFRRAAEDAARRFAHATVQHCVARGMALADPADLETRWQLLALRERDHDMLGQRAEQSADIDALQALAEALGDPHRLADVAWRRCDHSYRTGDFARTEAQARHCIAIAEAGDALGLALRAKTRLAQALNRRGDAAAALELARRGLEESRARGLRAQESLFLNTLSIIVAMHGDVVGSLALDLEHLALCRALGNRRDESNGLLNVGGSYLLLGANERAREFLEQGLALANGIGNRTSLHNAWFNLSVLALRDGDAAQALAHANAAVEAAASAADREGELFSWFCVGNAQLALGDARAAQAAYERSRSLAVDEGSAREFDATAGLARAAAALGESEQAIAWVDHLLGRLAGSGAFEGAESPVAILLACHRVLSGRDPARASQALACAHERLRAVAATISDAGLRHSFLNAVPEHRDVLAAWAARQ